LDGGVPPGHAANHQAPVERGEGIARRSACFVNAAQGAHGQGGVQGCRQPFSGNIAEVKTDGPVHELEIIQKITAYGGNRLKSMGDGHRAGAQRFRRQHDRLDGACFFEFFFSQLFNGMQFEQWRNRSHSPVRRGSITPGRGKQRQS